MCERVVSPRIQKSLQKYLGKGKAGGTNISSDDQFLVLYSSVFFFSSYRGIWMVLPLEHGFCCFFLLCSLFCRIFPSKQTKTKTRETKAPNFVEVYFFGAFLLQRNHGMMEDFSLFHDSYPPPHSRKWQEGSDKKVGGTCTTLHYNGYNVNSFLNIIELGLLLARRF